jgi:KamA family protein
MKYKSYNLSNYRDIPQIKNLGKELLEDIDNVGSVLPFKVNNYVTENLIDWSKVPDDPIFKLTFPQREMLIPGHYELIYQARKGISDKTKIKQIADRIRMKLNPHPAGQIQLNVPTYERKKLWGMQHKYKQTVLFFPSQGQTCHAYCTFCFRWPQFVGIDELKFASNEAQKLHDYVKHHPEVTDVLFTGGDPLIMKTRILETYIKPLISSNLPNLKHIRIGTKALAYWPFRFTKDDDSEELLKLFEEVKKAGKHLAFMAHFNHPIELENDFVSNAIEKILNTGAVIRTQSPVLKHINDNPDDWAAMLKKQVELGCIPYYMFIARNTGAQHYFSIPIIEAWNIFRKCYQQISGICRTVRGPSMSCLPGKVQLLGVSEIKGEKVMVFRMIQGRNPDWVARPFFAEYSPNATWYSDLKPAFGEDKFFFSDELNSIINNEEEENDFE